jgi:nucleoside-diphosphate-sugar epimerase
MKVAVIGANSLLASYITEQLLTDARNDIGLFGRRAAVVDGQANATFYYFDYPEALPDFKLFLSFDLLVYCAATGVQAGQAVTTDFIYELNAFLPIRLLNYLSNNNFSGKWVSFGSYFEIGNNDTPHEFSEKELVASSLTVPNHYCASKRLLTKFVDAGLITVKAYHFILPTIYGARENAKRLIPYIIDALQNQRPLQLSAGTQVRQYIHCRDVAALVQMVAVNDYPAGIYNLAVDAPIQIAQLVQYVFALFEQDATAYLGTLQTRDESMKYLAINSQKVATQIPEWRPALTIQQGLKEYTTAT